MNLVGRKILGMKIADDKMAILFITDKGEVIAKCCAGSCSSTWIEEVELPALGFPATVTAAHDLDLGRGPLENGEFKVLEFYGYKITTDKGDIVIDYRNESNGYYGGDLAWTDEDHYPGVYDQNESSMKWIEIVDG